MSINVYNTALELAKIIQEDESIIEQALVQDGETVVHIFQDENFKNSFQNLKEQKKNFFKMAIEDLAEGGNVLRHSELCLVFREGKVLPTTRSKGEEVNGILMFSIGLKTVPPEISQEKINAGIYKLTVALAEII